jgi:phosphomethylpyrimidine synthase
MMGIIEKADKGIYTRALREAAKKEGFSPEELAPDVAAGRVAVLASRARKNVSALGVGRKLRTKVNANIGTSGDRASVKDELRKLEVCVSAGADAVMDLSTGGDIDGARRKIIENCPVPLGTVPVYQAVIDVLRKKKEVKDMESERLFDVIEKQLEDGVDFITVHCGITINSVERLIKDKRLAGVVSRGGAFLVEWISSTGRENPLYEQYGRLLALAKKYDAVLSLGDGMRPGCIADATDRCQLQELIILGGLAQRAVSEGVQVMIEGPGHIPLNQVEANVLLEKSLCGGAPFYVLGPLVTDIAPGYDHITSAVGGAVAAAAGADFICYVTASEHLRLPSVEDVREGIMAARIAAHAGDIAKGVKGAADRDREISGYRAARNWKKQIELALDPEKAARLREESIPASEDVCTMCGEFCSMKRMDKILRDFS